MVIRIATYLFLLVAAGSVSADIVHLNNGGQIKCVVVEEEVERITVRLKSGTATIVRSDILKIVKDVGEASATSLAAWERCIGTALKEGWGQAIHQIPATVIDVGVLKNVPYTSYASGSYEINIYGDPADPAGIEIGIRDDLLKQSTAKKTCEDYIRALLRKDVEKISLSSMKLTTGSTSVGPLTIEITPETAEDAYGGWWISVYDSSRLEAMRASEEEMKALTVRRDSIAASKPVPERNQRNIERGREAAEQRQRRIAAEREADTDWMPDDVAQVRRSGGGGGSVYVRGYFRKNGTYVRPHTRSR